MFRKHFCMILAVALLFTQIESFATGYNIEPCYDGEIKFRDLDWGCSIDAAISNLEKAGISYNRYSIKNDITVNGKFSGISIDKSGVEFNAYQSDIPNDFYVAGHLVSQIVIKAIYGLSDGQIQKDLEDTNMYYAIYYFEPTSDTESVFDDLNSKLANLYGNTPYVYEDSFSGDCTITWYGADSNTCVVLDMNRFSVYDDRCVLSVAYWDLRVHDKIREMQDVIYYGDLSSTDGL